MPSDVQPAPFDGARISPTPFDPAQLLAEARELLADTIDLRRRIHAEPELGLDLPLTQAKVLAELEGLDLEVRTGSNLSSIVATLKGEAGGPTLLLRGDMDALPMPEDSGEPFASTFEGRMHACGHDAHTAMLVAAARLLHQHRAELRGNVKFLFQPGEEGDFGARVCLEEGLLENPSVDAGFALHVSPNIPSGFLATRTGALLAAADELTITVTGKGGHASTPHLAVDPIPVACEMVTAFQTHVARAIDPFTPAILTVATIHAGTANNVIPESVKMTGTLRTVDERCRESLHASLAQVADGIAAAHGCTVELDWSFGYPVTENHPVFTEGAMEILNGLVGHMRFVELPAPVMGAEDWSYVLQKIPGAMAFLGVCPPEAEFHEAPACHSNKMRVDEDAMAVGIAAHVAMALSYLA